ncbi:hypothetical protein BGZ58_002057 [Dissophora ornata]|nr:hypothetical protein BGZ58_002057 [Dissophora ornata]
MAGSSGKKSTTGSSGRVQKKVPAKSAAASKNTSGSGSGSSVYTGTAKGVTVLPVARVKRIIKEDKDVQMVSNDAVFLISLATELFLESFTSKAYNLAKMEKRKTVSYKDLDVVPKTTPLSAALEKRRVAKEKEENGTMEDDEEGDQENNAAQEESEGEGERSGSEEANNSRGHMSDEEDLSAPEDMDED